VYIYCLLAWASAAALSGSISSPKQFQQRRTPTGRKHAAKRVKNGRSSRAGTVSTGPSALDRRKGRRAALCARPLLHPRPALRASAPRAGRIPVLRRRLDASPPALWRAAFARWGSPARTDGLKAPQVQRLRQAASSKRYPEHSQRSAPTHRCIYVPFRSSRARRAGLSQRSSDHRVWRRADAPGRRSSLPEV
jgi:hypothetical protein